jgi:hypothetical protein
MPTQQLPAGPPLDGGLHRPLERRQLLVVWVDRKALLLQPLQGLPVRGEQVQRGAAVVAAAGSAAAAAAGGAGAAGGAAAGTSAVVAWRREQHLQADGRLFEHDPLCCNPCWLATGSKPAGSRQPPL